MVAVVTVEGLGPYEEEDVPMADNFPESQPELRNISNFLSYRFRISPPVFADVFNSLLQEQIGTGLEHANHTDDIYSPTSPLQINFSSSESKEDTDNKRTATSQNHQIVLGLQCNSDMFTSKHTRDGNLNHSRSADNIFMLTGTKNQFCVKKRKKRYEDWDAKGGFNMRTNLVVDDTQSKALTNISMAHDMGVEATFVTGSLNGKKEWLLLHQWILRVYGPENAAKHPAPTHNMMKQLHKQQMKKIWHYTLR